MVRDTEGWAKWMMRGRGGERKEGREEESKKARTERRKWRTRLSNFHDRTRQEDVRKDALCGVADL